MIDAAHYWNLIAAEEGWPNWNDLDGWRQNVVKQAYEMLKGVAMESSDD